jgi:acetolactate synthase-1/2/3 large subunit/sulfoacetaldehyde acetyltransferase
MSETTGGHAVVELLKAEGVRYIFGIVGATFLDVLDALYDDRSVEYINVRHEQAAAMMADGLARVSGLPGVCLVTSGPGATNLLTGVAAAHVAHSPVVVLVGGVPLEHYQKDAFQDFDLVGMFRPVTKLAVQVTRADRIGELLRAALRTAMTGRRGPVFVEIPREILNERVPGHVALPPERYRITRPAPPNAEAIREAAALLRGAERPLLLVGGGATWAGANDLVLRLAEAHDWPMITAYGRNDAVPSAHPLYVGPLGRAGAPEAAAACRRADVILAVGSRLAQFTTHFDDRHIRPETRLVQIDVDSRDIGRYYPVAVGIQADAGEACRALIEALARGGAGRAPAAWRDEAHGLRAKRQARLEAESRLDARPLKPQRVYAELRRALPPDTIVTLDAGAAPAYGYDRLVFTRPAASSPRSTSAGSGSPSPPRSGPSSGGPRRRCSPFTATAAS